MSNTIHFLFPANADGDTYGFGGEGVSRALDRIAENYNTNPAHLTLGPDWWPISLCPVQRPRKPHNWHYTEWKPVYLGETLLALLLRW